MKKTVIFLILITLNVFAQNLLKPVWKFNTGDDLKWAAVDFNDSQWKEISAGTIWEKQGFEGYDGFAWYRTSVVIPSSLKADAKKNGGLLLDLGKIDDADETFFNGVKIGFSGGVPPEFKNAYADLRKYNIDFDKINWDKANVIAVRVWDNGGGGGMYSYAPELKVKGATDNLVIEPKFPQSNRIFLNNASISIPLNITYSGSYSIEGKVVIKVLSDFGKLAYETKLDLSLPKNSKKTIDIPLGKLEPGFYNASINVESATSNKSIQFAFGVDPEKIVSPTDRQPDFENYWNRAKKELAAVDPQYKLILVDSLSKESRNVYVVEMRSLGNVLVRGWYAVPKKSGKYPALLVVQGYSSFLQLDWAYKGDDFVVLALNVRGHGFSKDNVNPGFPGYLQHFVNDKEQYIYRGAYMDTRRALDFLVSRPEVDSTRMVVEGGSQGGALSVATAALNPDRIKLCIPAVPFLSDFRDYFVVGNWPGNEFKEYVAKNPNVGWEKVYETLSYIDIKNLAPWVKCPVLMGIGLVDDVCPPHIN
ncbi:MAG: acetylxylan esterase, partial [Bacteroidota bacterium]|nr:acetylxylan esterase [Bacteroidota bacterium]